MTPPPIDHPEEEEMSVPHSEFAASEGSQPVNGDANAADASAKFRWTIENFSRLTREKLYSDVFSVGGYGWRVLVYPKGNVREDWLSVYLDVADSSILPYGWSKDAQFSLAVVDQIHGKFTILKDAQHQFNARESDWGFTSFMPLTELYDPSKGYLLNDTCIVEADVAVRKVVDNQSHDSKKETGYVEPENQAAPAEDANAVDAPIVDDPSSARFTWTIENFSRLTDTKLRSDVFVAGGYEWRVCIFPKGNGVDHLSMYLDVADSTTLPHGWSRDAQFSLAVVDQIHSKFTITKDAQHQFNARESDWGFTTFMPLSDLHDPSKGYLLNDACMVEAVVAVRKVVDVENSG